MLSSLLLAALLAAPIATLILFLPAADRGGHSDDAWRFVGRTALALASTLVLIAVVAGILGLIGATGGNIEAAAIGLAAFSVLWLPFTRRWGARAHLCWAATTFMFATYLAFMIWWTLVSHLGPAGTVGGLFLWLLEVVAAILGCAYLWELCDTLGRATWVRRIGDTQLYELPDGPYPFACLQVPCYNEPPEMVIETLESLRSLDYPDYEIQVIDDNTDDEKLWHPVKDWCDTHGVKFVHLQDWPGYKSGALNYALQHMVDDRCELIGVVDSDYQIDPEFLRECAPLFIDPRVGFIQAPQDYRDWESAPYLRRLYYSYKYFFAISQPSRNERDGAIFAGTMGLIRRRALDAVGGWDEWCITEDAELSLRLLRAGWSGLHVDRSFGKGIMPLTFEALKGQRFRWCFGGIQILRQHWRWMLPGRKTEANQLRTPQRWAYLTGAIQWYGDLLAIVFFVFLLVGAGNVEFSAGLLYRKLTAFLLAAIPLLVTLGLLRAVALLRRGTGASWRDAFGAFFIWQATALTVARAAVQALYAKEAAFLRTPKTRGEPRWSDALKANWAECLLGLLGLAGIAGALSHASSYGGPLLAALLLWPTVSFLAAPYNSLSSQRTALSPELSERRRTEHLRYGHRRLTYALGSLGLAGGTAGVAMALLIPGPAQVVLPQILGPARGHPVDYTPASTQGRSPSGNRKATRHVKSKRFKTLGNPSTHRRRSGSTAPITRTTRRSTPTTRTTATSPTSTATTTSTTATSATSSTTTTTGTTTSSALAGPATTATTSTTAS
ncbi:MAG TPA: glycosyltransferase [Solirubrobacteraceae bacterium]|nr:glycosyltransferase [Solirubrobacteraceae bacterium]